MLHKLRWQRKKRERRCTLLYADIGIREGDVKVDYIVPCDGQSRDVFEAAFPNCDEYDGTSYRLTEYLNAHPHE